MTFKYKEMFINAELDKLHFIGALKPFAKMYEVFEDKSCFDKVLFEKDGKQITVNDCFRAAHALLHYSDIHSEEVKKIQDSILKNAYPELWEIFNKKGEETTEHDR